MTVIDRRICVVVFMVSSWWVLPVFSPWARTGHHRIGSDSSDRDDNPSDVNGHLEAVAARLANMAATATDGPGLVAREGEYEVVTALLRDAAQGRGGRCAAGQR